MKKSITLVHCFAVVKLKLIVSSWIWFGNLLVASLERVVKSVIPTSAGKF